MLLRRIFPRSIAAHAGGWDKSADGSYEVRGKTLGIVGYGNIGTNSPTSPKPWACASSSSISPTSCAAAIPNRPTRSRTCSRHDDVVSLHVPETPQTHSMMGEAADPRDEEGRLSHQQQPRHGRRHRRAGRARCSDGHLRGAAIDVFPVEPAPTRRSSSRRCRGCKTSSSRRMSAARPRRRRSASAPRSRANSSIIATTGATFGAVNFPQAQLPPRAGGTRFIHVHRNVPACSAHQPGLRAPRHQHRRAISADRRRHRLCRGRRRRRSHGTRAGVRGTGQDRGNDQDAVAVADREPSGSLSAR